MQNSILYLHGGGTSDKHTTGYLQESLRRFDITGYSFDFSGQGATPTALRESSLEHRCREAQSAISKFRLTEPLTVCGSSMGGYIAIKLLETYAIEHLILFCPAVYDRKAFSLSFDEKFSSVIRVKDSWKNSDAFEILDKFTGKILIITGEKDEVIPPELLVQLATALTHASYKEIITIPGCPHKIHGWLRTEPIWTEKIADAIAAFLKR